MRLFLKDHLSFIFLYVVTFLGLPFLIETLDGFANHYEYFIFLSIVLFICFLFIRYYRRRKMYMHLEETKVDRDSINIYQPLASIEKEYANQLKSVSSLILEEDEKHQDSFKEQQLMISHAVHQMKIPVSVIQLLVQSNQTLHLESSSWRKVKSECNKLNFTLNQLLTYNRSTQLLSDFKIEPARLKNTVQEVVNDLKDYFIEAEVFPKVMISKDVILFTDQKWMKTAVYQLLSNAIKYGDKHSTISIQYIKGELSITNQGDTIPKSEINRIFDLFYTGSEGRKQENSTGIGLYLVKKILNTLNHPFTFESIQGETVCTINLLESVKITDSIN